MCLMITLAMENGLCKERLEAWGAIRRPLQYSTGPEVFSLQPIKYWFPTM